MIKIVYCITRRPHLIRDQFQEYWLNHHGKPFGNGPSRSA